MLIKLARKNQCIVGFHMHHDIKGINFRFSTKPPDRRTGYIYQWQATMRKICSFLHLYRSIAAAHSYMEQTKKQPTS